MMKIVSKILTVFATVTFSVMCTVVFLEVVFRHFLTMPLVWSEELARIMLIWTVFSGAGAILIRGEHIALEFLLDKLSGKPAEWLRILNLLIGISFLICLLIGSFRMIEITWVIRAESVPIIRMAYQYIVLFTGAAVMFLFSLGSVFRMLKGVLSKKAL
jgi:TRAP-type C4-dicarboxylate transport system permease small subunit